MTRTVLSIVALSAALTLAATPREYVADKLKDVKGKTNTAKKRLDEAGDKVDDASKGLAAAREQLKTVKTKMAASQGSLDEAGTNLTAAIAGCKKMGELLNALPPATPGRADLLDENGKQLTRLQSVESKLKQASAANGEAVTALGDADTKLDGVGGKLSKDKLDKVGDQLGDIDSIVDQTSKVNKAAMPNFPDIKELK